MIYEKRFTGIKRIQNMYSNVVTNEHNYLILTKTAYVERKFGVYMRKMKIMNDKLMQKLY